MKDFTNRIPELDGIRGMAILLILVYHWVALEGHSILPNAQEPQKVVLRYENAFAMSDYWLGLFRADDVVPSPFFVRQPNVQTLTLGTTTAPVVLDTSNPPQRYAYYSMKLPPGDYKTTVAFTRSDRTRSNVGGTVAVLGPQ